MLDRLESTTVSRDYLTEILQSMSESLVVLSPDGRISLANRAMCRLLGYDDSELSGMLFERLLAGEPETPNGSTDPISRLQQEGQLDQVETCYLDRAGRPIDVLMSGALMSGADGVLRAMICIAQDNRERKRQEQQIRRLAFFDVVTGLPNRAHFRQILARVLADRRQYSCKVAVLFLDLDRFKRINDTLGHATGDRLLEGFAMRLAQCVRLGDTVARLDGVEDGSTVARLGGDEFTVILHRISSSQDAARVARRILKALDEPFMLAGHEIVIDASVGISIYPDDGLDPETLLMHADTAMYHAKSQGCGNFQFFHSELNARAMGRLSLEADLRKALSTEQLSLHFQPQVSLATGEVEGVEALLRWYHPQRGLVPTSELIALAEETGLIIPIGKWVLRSGCATARAWIDQGIGEVPVAINVSNRQLRQDGFVEEVKSALADHRLSARLLELEITESTAMAEPEATVEILRQLKDMGIEVAIDDFGTGYSSLSYLKRFPIGCVKIDWSFVRDVVNSPEDAGIVDAIVALARQLRFRVVAEGVETREQAEFLHSHGCDRIQGYLVSRPQPAEQLAKWLRTRRRPISGPCGPPPLGVASEDVVYPG
jgi:diguanylate cyclase (GGDEF)-like protein/PAS domain S-box-containing protein